jgi:NADPH:quinone reductase
MEAAMLALVATGNGRVEVERREVPEPAPRDHEALIAVRAVSLNRGEVSSLATSDEGAQPGWDIAGEVLAAAVDGSGPGAGKRVVGLAASAGWAQRVAVRTDMLATLPAAVDDAAASALPVAGLTAWRALNLPEQLTERRVLVTGAAGGVGHFAVQLANRLGASVTGVVGSEARAAALRELCAIDVSIGMPDEGEFDLILESVGGQSLARALALVARRGWIVSYGVSSREPSAIDIGPFFRKGGTRLYGLLIFEELAHHRSGARDLGILIDWMARDALRPQIGLDVGWRDANRAIQALMAREVHGKAVLRID